MGSAAGTHSKNAPIDDAQSIPYGGHGVGTPCQTCNRTHGTSIVAEGSESQIRQFLSQIQGLDQSRVQNATTKCALVDILHDAHTQCLRVWGTARLPKSCSPAFISEVKRLRKEDPERANQMIQEKRNGQPMASRMVQDAERCLGVLEQDGESGCAWLKELKPDWSDSVSLLRSVYTTRTNVAAMTRLSSLTGSSTHSFCILVSIMRAIKFNDWTAACKMWAFEQAPDGGHPIVGGTPEMLLECEPAQLDNLLQSNDVSVLEEDHCDDCAVCLCPMATGECVRKLKCGHSFHKGCVGSWIDQQWKRAHQLGSLTDVSSMIDVAQCPLCRQGIGLGGGLGIRVVCWQNMQIGQQTLQASH